MENNESRGYENVGGKIKDFARTTSTIMIVFGWVIASFVFLALISNEFTAQLCWIPLLIAGLLHLVIWIISWFMYGFGELIESNMEIRDMLKNQNRVQAEKAKQPKDELPNL